jgi:phage shock protein A
MNLFSRVSAVRGANLDDLLRSASDPLKTIRQIIIEMEDALVEARSTAVRLLARQKELQRHIQHAQQEAHDWADKAKLALSKDREDLARGALSCKLKSDTLVLEYQRLLPPVEAEIAKLDGDIGDLCDKLTDARQRHKLLELQGDSASARKGLKAQLFRRTDPAFEAASNQVSRLQAEVDSYDLGQDSLKKAFQALQADPAVEAELARLKSQLDQSVDKGA